ncbi:hypothetical protein C5708_10035 [Caulobacter sp. CCUG 60055]|uniref:GIY-YIG nuclease family protein n=1 Tax=Caulobacter sp. CCUG 60055 TaxID=2100090 RepID=UPI001FA731CE|nr:GIY-YIG nuclease family protein [Caulobacter sp. CCUG 60055]MBQ1543945.1 GIY-YIG nuclease family protein [Caulobacteraceae bacterium]MCI3180595.1 hypothetical protein [Caulobacter sp. CCUG 60055]
MDGADRKAAIAAYKERKTAAGVFVIRCLASGEQWVGESTHLDTQQNGLWFALRHGGGLNPGLKAAWRAHGEAAFVFEALERLPEDVPAYLRRGRLRELGDAWRTRLGALRC